MSTPASTFDKLAALATLGTRRAPAPTTDWPDESLAPVGEREPSPATTLLRAATAAALFDAAGARSAPDAESRAARDFPAAQATLVNEVAAWRLARIIGGENRDLLGEWFELAAAAHRVLPPHLLPLVLDNVPPQERRGTGAVLGPAAPWLAARHASWIAEAPVVEPSDTRWREGSLPERLAELHAVRRVDRARSREWLRATWDEDPPDAREAFLMALLPTLEPDDEPFLEAALDDKRKAVRQAAADALARLPESAHATRNRERLEGLLVLGAEKGGVLGLGRRRKLAVELPTAPDKAAVRDGVEPKVPASRKIGERAYWLVQMVAFVPPRRWCEKFECDAETFFAAVLASDYAHDLTLALTEAATRHPDPEWSLLLARHWIGAQQDFTTVVDAMVPLIAAVTPEDRGAIVETLVAEAKPNQFAYTSLLLSKLDIAWSARLTGVAFRFLVRLVADSGSKWTQPRNALEDWARRCDRTTGAHHGAALLDKCGDGHPWRNALERFNDIVAFRVAMQEELTR